MVWRCAAGSLQLWQLSSWFLVCYQPTCPTELQPSEVRNPLFHVSYLVLMLSVLQLLSGAPVSQLMQFLEAFTDGDQLWRLAGA